MYAYQILKYRNDPKFQTGMLGANSADPDQTGAA